MLPPLPSPPSPPAPPRGQNSVSYRATSTAGYEKDLDYYCNDAYDIINLAFLHYFKDPSSGKGPGNVSLPNINLANHCDTTFASLADPQFPTSGLLKVRKLLTTLTVNAQCLTSPQQRSGVAAKLHQSKVNFSCAFPCLIPG